MASRFKGLHCFAQNLILHAKAAPVILAGAAFFDSGVFSVSRI
jgi:hypothetical protein